MKRKINNKKQTQTNTVDRISTQDVKYVLISLCQEGRKNLKHDK